MYNIPKDSLLILVGIPGSGKSTLAKEISKDKNEIVSADSIRKELLGSEEDQTNNQLVFEEFHKRIEERLQKGQFTIADSMSLDKFARENLYQIAQKYKRPIRVAILNVTLSQVIRQNNSRERKLPTSVIIKRYEKLKAQYQDISKEIDSLPDARICDIFIKNASESSLER